MQHALAHGERRPPQQPEQRLQVLAPLPGSMCPLGGVDELDDLGEELWRRPHLVLGEVPVEAAPAHAVGRAHGLGDLPVEPEHLGHDGGCPLGAGDLLDRADEQEVVDPELGTQAKDRQDPHHEHGDAAEAEAGSQDPEVEPLDDEVVPGVLLRAPYAEHAQPEVTERNTYRFVRVVEVEQAAAELLKPAHRDLARGDPARHPRGR